ncbi:PhnA domain-containing protein [Candidatus Sulfurimonas baltica]|uniref:PhnA domain-containing protein n=1 Tax=Candidatus Sulfurimonas baltica TaxID=2740404 RepID=A0A7S7RN40_9BACT|nr:alkylphosphonate utilization protein [Candidatus Sulfurimonas baltica]QOY52139.1 PhnA domain-containing protein [Candidatus Sulfurimonas baltica]
MSIVKELQSRSGGVCELCGGSDGLTDFEVAPSDGSSETSVCICSTCRAQIENPDSMDENHFNCLNDSMWSEIPAVKVLTFRLLSLLNRQDLMDMMYLEEIERAWAESGIGSKSSVVHKDSNGVVLQAGDTVVIIKDLEVKGAGFTAKRGTAVRNISLVHDDAEHIEGRVNGTKIFILTKFLKKS